MAAPAGGVLRLRLPVRHCSSMSFRACRCLRKKKGEKKGKIFKPCTFYGLFRDRKLRGFCGVLGWKPLADWLTRLPQQSVPVQQPHTPVTGTLSQPVTAQWCSFAWDCEDPAQPDQKSSPSLAALAPAWKCHQSSLGMKCSGNLIT